MKYTYVPILQHLQAIKDLTNYLNREHKRVMTENGRLSSRVYEKNVYQFNKTRLDNMRIELIKRFNDATPEECMAIMSYLLGIKDEEQI